MKTEAIREVSSPAAPRPETSQGYDRVLVPIDFSPPSLKALHYARALTRGAVQLVHVVEPLDFVPTDIISVGSDEDRTTAVHRELVAVAEAHNGHGPHLSTTVRLGQAGAQVASLALEWHAELLVLSTHGRTGLPHLLLGSVAEKILRRATCPVLVLRKHEHDFVSARPGELPYTKLGRILVPLDFKPRSLEALRFAVDFAGRFGGRITLVHAVHLAGASLDEQIPGIDTASLLQQSEQRARAKMVKLLSETSNRVSEHAAVMAGPPLSVIPRVAAEGHFDLIICATDSSAPVRHAFLGSTAEGLIRHAPCPVLVVPSRLHSAATSEQPSAEDHLPELKMAPLI